MQPLVFIDFLILINVIMFVGKYIENGSVREQILFLKQRNYWNGLEHIYYNAKLNQIISCSNDQQSAVVVGCVRASASSEIQLTETGFSEVKTARAKSADPKLGPRKRGNTMSTGQFSFANKSI